MLRLERIRKLVFVVALASLLALTVTAYAQTPTPNQINDVAKDLWCPLCNGVRLDNCELQACVQMREVIGQKLAAGESRDSIKSYFVQQYGDVVLGQPSTQGFNLIAWVFPILAAVVGLGWVAYIVVTWQRRKKAPVVATAGARGVPSTGPRQGAADTDDYMKRVERELRETE